MRTIFELIDDGDADGIRSVLVAQPSARDLRNTEGLSPLLYAAYRGCGPAFNAILAAGEPTDCWDRLVAGCADGLPAPGEWSPDGLFTPLHLAALVDNVPGATALLETGADPNVLATASYARVTPLGTCAFENAPEVARVLLEHGADPALAENDEGRATPLAVAEANGFDELAAILRGAL